MAAINYIKYATGTELQSRLKSAINGLHANHNELVFLLDKMNSMNDDADFSAVEAEFGIEAGYGDDARNELASYMAKMTTDASVTAVDAARKQLIAKMG